MNSFVAIININKTINERKKNFCFQINLETFALQISLNHDPRKSLEAFLPEVSLSQIKGMKVAKEKGNSILKNHPYFIHSLVIFRNFFLK